MLGLGALGQFPLGGGPTGLVSPTDINWFAPLSIPVRFKRAPRAAVAVNNQTIAFNPVPVVSFGWFGAMSEPTRRRKFGLPGYEQQFIALNPRPFVSFGWFEELSKPPTLAKRGLRPSLQQFFTTDTAVTPITKLIAWFDWLSDPVRTKPGLKASLQQFLAAPPRLLPTPAISGILDALETKDTFLAGAMIWNRATDAEIGVINTTPQPAEIGLYQTAPTAGTITVRISIVIG